MRRTDADAPLTMGLWADGGTPARAGESIFDWGSQKAFGSVQTALYMASEAIPQSARFPVQYRSSWSRSQPRPSGVRMAALSSKESPST